MLVLGRKELLTQQFLATAAQLQLQAFGVHLAGGKAVKQFDLSLQRCDAFDQLRETPRSVLPVREPHQCLALDHGAAVRDGKLLDPSGSLGAHLQEVVGRQEYADSTHTLGNFNRYRGQQQQQPRHDDKHERHERRRRGYDANGSEPPIPLRLQGILPE